MSVAPHPTTRTTSELISDCVHCGFCLPACPTYRSWGNEPDSPRGRIDLMKGLEEGTLDLSDAVVEHFDACLGCMACVTACPSGVRYDLLIESTRAKVETGYQRTQAERGFRELIFSLFPYPERLAALSVPLLVYARSGLQKLVRASKVLDRLSARLAQLEALMPDISLADVRPTLPPTARCAAASRSSQAACSGRFSRTSTRPRCACCRRKASTSPFRWVKAVAVRYRCTPGGPRKRGVSPVR